MEPNLTAKKRPVGVWVMSIFYLFSALWTLLGFYLIYSGSISVTPAQKTYFESLTLVDWISTIFLILINLSAATALFLLRRQALYLFITGFTLNILITIWHILSKNWLTAISGSGLIGMLIGWGLLVVVCWYCWKLTKSGLLT